MKKYKMPTKSNLKSRISTMNNAFAYSIMPWFELSEDDYESILKKLNIKENQCAYCLGKNATTMDHLNGLIKNSEPTGYFTEKNNLVPCCSSCNSSKSNKTFDEWYLSENNVKRLKNKITHKQMKERYTIITNYIKNNRAPKLDIENIIGENDYKTYQKIKKELNDKIIECQLVCEKIKTKLDRYVEDNKNLS